MMKGLMLALVVAGSFRAAAQVPQPVWQIELQSRGWRVGRDLSDGTLWPHTLDFADDDSLWVAFPTEASKALHSGDHSARYLGKVLHVAASGDVLGECETGTQRWSFLRLFAHRADGFTLDLRDKLMAYDGRCNERAAYSPEDRAGMYPSPNRRVVYAKRKDNHVRVLDLGNLEVIRDFDIPANAQRDYVLFGDHAVIIATTKPTRGCWQSQFSRLEVAAGRVTPWVTIDCADFNLLGDGHIIYTGARGDKPLEIVGDNGITTTAYKPPRRTYLDHGALESTPVASPQSLRIVEELIEARGRHPALDMDGRFVGRDIVLLDMNTGTALLTIKVPLSTQNYAYALSRDGKNLAVLLNSQLSLYRIP